MTQDDRDSPPPIGETELRLPPHSVPNEQSVLGALLLDNEAFERIGDLTADHFYRNDHRLIFAAIATAIEQRRPADVITIFDALTAAGRINDVGGLVYLNALAQNTPSSANVRRYAEIVRDRAIRRAIITASDVIAEAAYDGKNEAADVLDDAGARFEAIGTVRDEQEPVSVADEIDAHLQRIDDRSQGKDPALSFGFPDLDAKFSGGMRDGDLIVVAGRPKMGKTAFVMAVARHAAEPSSSKKRGAVTIFELEMTRPQLHDRNIAAVGHIDLGRILSGNLLDDDWPRITDAAGVIRNLSMYVDDRPAQRLIDIRMKSRRIARRYGLRLVVVDYLQLMAGKGDNRDQLIGEITRGLKALAKELGVPIILLSQLNRKVEDRPNKRPNASDLRESGSIEQDADAILLLYRDEVYNPETNDKGVCEVNVAANRSGAPGRVHLTFIAPEVRFESISGGWQPSLPPSGSPRIARAPYGDGDD